MRLPECRLEDSISIVLLPTNQYSQSHGLLNQPRLNELGQYLYHYAEVHIHIHSDGLNTCLLHCY